MVIPADELAARARTWGESDERVGALIVYGSVAQGRADVFSDLDLIVVARPGQREALWSERAGTGDRLLGEPSAWNQEPYWQRPFRYQAWRADLAGVDLTFDEGRAQPWEALPLGFDALVDRDGIVAALEKHLAGWQPEEFDAVAADGGTWVWLNWLLGRLRHGELWFVRCEVMKVLRRQVVPLLGAADHAVHSVLDESDRSRLHAAAPNSGEPDELWRALRATAELYDDALIRWADRTGRLRPENPLRRAVLARLQHW